MKFLSICACALATILSAKTASAQAGFYALFTGANLDNTQTSQPNVSLPSTSITTTTQLFGPTLGIYGDIPTPVVKIGCDFRGELLNGDGKQHYNGVIGPRVSVALPAVKLKLYGEFLYGFGSYKTTTPLATVHADYEYVAGVDRKLYSLLDWRILEFSYSNYFNGSVATKGLSTGLVVRVP
jgi:hypothetical protein